MQLVAMGAGNQADESGKTALGNGAAVFSILWIFYLYLLFYLAITVGSVSHPDLFFERPVDVSFFTVAAKPSLLAFFFLAPIVFLVVHAYTLGYLVILKGKAERFKQERPAQITDNDTKDKTTLAVLLPTNIFIDLPERPTEIPGIAGWLSTFAWTTLELAPVLLTLVVLAPVLLLLFTQIRFLPFHSGVITWTHRLALITDLTLLWWLLRKLVIRRDADRRGGSVARLGHALPLALGASTIFFALFIATFPGEWQQNYLTFRAFSGTLDLSGLDIYRYGGLGIGDMKREDQAYIFHARGRDLKGANLDFATLPKVDFTGADIEGASLNRTDLTGASLNAAELRGALFDAA